MKTKAKVNKNVSDHGTSAPLYELQKVKTPVCVVWNRNPHTTFSPGVGLPEVHLYGKHGPAIVLPLTIGQLLY